MQAKLDELSNAKLDYKRNFELNAANDDLKGKLRNMEAELEQEQARANELKNKVNSEQDFKSKYKEKNQMCYRKKIHCYKLGERLRSDNDTEYRQMHSYSDNLRQLFMILQGKENVSATQVSKFIKLVAKYLFKKNIPLTELPCPRTCLNFMEEANHIAMLHIASEIKPSHHFTYGTSREKRHYMEHHLVMEKWFHLVCGLY